MARIIKGGWLDGRLIRKARKEFTCDYWRGLSNGGRCNKPINPGDDYVEGESDLDRAGGFGHERYCFECIAAEDRQIAA